MHAENGPKRNSISAFSNLYRIVGFIVADNKTLIDVLINNLFGFLHSLCPVSIKH